MVLSTIKQKMPVPLKVKVRQGIKFFKYHYRRIRIAFEVKQRKPLKIIVGAAETFQPGWLSTNEQWLDITSTQDWQAVFQGQQLLTHVVAEHVFEHLTPQQSLDALTLIHQHLMPNGRIRIAVPDGYHPDPTYLKHVGINGIGADAADHKQLLNCDRLFDLLSRTGFSEIELLEGYDANQQLVQKQWTAQDGFIHRSRQNPDHHVWDFVDANTSLIVDAVRRG
jgi:predicted SAM-dependent methyltransferase